jgi:hypothetical protein
MKKWGKTAGPTPLSLKKIVCLKARKADTHHNLLHNKTQIPIQGHITQTLLLQRGTATQRPPPRTQPPDTQLWRFGALDSKNETL